MSWWGLGVGLVVAGAMAWIGGALWLEHHGAQARPEGNFDVIIVPGCAVTREGRPSQALDRRVREAVSQWKAGRAPLILLTGGAVVNPPAEAEVAAARCQELGVPKEAILLESRSRTTLENAQYAAQIVQGRVLVVTDASHVFRCRCFFAEYFEEVAIVGVLGKRPRPRARLALREALAVIVHTLGGRLATRRGER